MGKRNVASGNDQIDIQAAEINTRKGGTPPPRSDDKKDDSKGRTINHVSGNAKVGLQADTVNNVWISW